MNFKTLFLSYWVLFLMAIFILFVNFGIVLMTLGIILVPIIILHIRTGINLKNIKNSYSLILLSGINLLLFSLVRIDGTFTSTDNGFTALMKFIGFHTQLSNENFSDYTSMVTFIIQIILEVILADKLNLIKKANNLR